MSCQIEGCEYPIYTEDVCLWHYPLWEYWGYEEDGYETYANHGREKGREAFKKFLSELGHQKIVDILTNYDWKLTQAVNESIESDKLRNEENPPDTHITHITLVTGDKLTETERSLVEQQLEWICETQLIPLKGLIIGGEPRRP